MISYSARRLRTINMITPISTSPAPVHRSREKPPRHDGVFGCTDSVGEGEAVGVSSSDSVGLGVEVADFSTVSVSVGADVAARVDSVVAVMEAVGVSVAVPVGSVEVTSVEVADAVGVSVAVDVGRVASGVAV
jgi:hypothetical protein